MTQREGLEASEPKNRRMASEPNRSGRRPPRKQRESRLKRAGISVTKTSRQEYRGSAFQIRPGGQHFLIDQNSKVQILRKKCLAARLRNRSGAQAKCEFFLGNFWVIRTSIYSARMPHSRISRKTISVKSALVSKIKFVVS